MVTRSEWVQKVCEAWSDEPCPRCGRSMRPYHVDEEGYVIAECSSCDIERTIAREFWPAQLDPEPDESEDLPF